MATCCFVDAHNWILHFRVWDILTRVPDGIVICGQHLPQQPTLSELTVYELSFALKIELLLSRVSFPEYRHLMVELLMVIDVILRRNHEFSFTARVDLDEVNIHVNIKTMSYNTIITITFIIINYIVCCTVIYKIV